MSVLTVWRDKPGASLSTLARPGSRSPLAAESKDYEIVESSRLRALVASKNVFGAVHVPLEVAEEVLGWTADE